MAEIFYVQAKMPVDINMRSGEYFVRVEVGRDKMGEPFVSIYDPQPLTEDEQTGKVLLDADKAVDKLLISDYRDALRVFLKRFFEFRETLVVTCAGNPGRTISL